MISVLIYGRNDSHGYNLQKRACLSLNSIASVLQDPDDEIIFVDWNTENGFPPFPISISDTLTRVCKERIKIIQVPPEVHGHVANSDCRKPTIEPIARNVGIRRANPKNQWILSTNSDVLLRVNGGRLGAIVKDLDGDYYGSPRFELPEWLWESLPRDDPVVCQETLSRWLLRGFPRNIVESSENVLYDAPGDFQLMRRESLQAIGCFDETMQKGWHVDSNLAKRMRLAYGDPRSLEQEVQVFHCNHNRQVTHFHASGANSIQTYYTGITSPMSQSGTTDWGLPNDLLQVTTIRDYEEKRRSVLASLEVSQSITIRTSLIQPEDNLAGVSPLLSAYFLTDMLLNSHASVYYVGNNHELAQKLEIICQKIGKPFRSLAREGRPLFPAPEATDYVFDLTPPLECVRHEARCLIQLASADKESLGLVLACMEDLVHCKEMRSRNDLIAILNASCNEFEDPLETFFVLTPAQYYARVSRARPIDWQRSAVRDLTAMFLRPFIFFLDAVLNSFGQSMTEASARIRSTPKVHQATRPLLSLMGRSANKGLNYLGTWRESMVRKSTSLSLEFDPRLKRKLR